MKIILRSSSQCLMLAFLVFLATVPVSYAALQPDMDAEIGAQLIESKIDFLVSSLEGALDASGRSDIVISRKLQKTLDKWKKAMASPDSPIYQDVKETGKLYNTGDPVLAGQKLDDTVKSLFDLMIANEDLDPESLAAIQELLALLGEGPEAYSPSGVITGAQGENRGDGMDRSDRERADFNPSPNPNFRFYGKPYNLDTDTTKTNDGILLFNSSLDNDVPVAISPYYNLDGSHQVTDGGTSQVDLANSTYRNYQWNVTQSNVLQPNAVGANAPNPTATVSAKVFEGTGTPVIAIDYYNDPDTVAAFGGLLTGGAAGILPGSGAVGEPGEGAPRDLITGQDAINILSGGAIYYPGENYTGVGNLDKAGNVYLNTGIVLRPDNWDVDNDHGSTYSKHLVTRNLVVDFDSVMGAEDAIIGDADAEAAIRNGMFTPDNYTLGVQTEISDFNDIPGISLSAAESMAMLNNDGFLSYYVQYEEHLLNQELIEMAENADELKAMLAMGNRSPVLAIPEMDAMMDAATDAKAGWVGKDIHGNWTRTVQAVFRPDNNTAQFLNVTFRAGDAGDAAGMNKMNLTAEFDGAGYSMNSDLNLLPWSDFLKTKDLNGEGPSMGIANNSGVDLSAMYVEFTNPSGETIKETREFGTSFFDFDDYNQTQPIIDQDLFLKALDKMESYDFYSGGYRIDVWNLDPLNPDHATAGFDIVLNDKDRTRISVSVYGLPDSFDGVIRDIWDALRVNERNAPRIGDTNLQIIIDGDKVYFNKPFDIVYIPMSRMIWKEKGNILEEP